MASYGGKKLSKSERKKLLSDRGKIGAEKRGVGVGSRQDFVLPSQWRVETHEYASHDAMKIVSPGKTRYHNVGKVKETLRQRNMTLCIGNSSESSEEVSGSDYELSPVKRSEVQEQPIEPVVERQIFVGESTQITAFVEGVNRTSRCSTTDCSGILIPAKVDVMGLGGSINITFACNGCQSRTVSFQGSAMVENSRRTVVGLALAVAFVVTGHGFAKFSKTLNECLGIQALSKNRFYEVITKIYPHVQDILNGMCDEEKEKMKEIDGGILGSWERAVVTSDGVWHTRGHFSKNGSFIIKNYLTGGLLWFRHKSMRGMVDEEEEDELFLGTSKAMEGVLADECYSRAKEEGCGVEVVWQDGDSSSEKSVHKVFGDVPRKVYKCGGHVGRAHGNNLKDLAKQKQFSAVQISKLRKEFPEAESVKCECKRHNKSCGCLSEQFINTAKINYFCCLQQCTDPSEYARRMRALGKHHVKNVHTWKGGECGFHPLSVCSCGECPEEENHQCEGQPYATKNVLKCRFHQLVYQTECELRAEDAEAVIHPELGRGHSNQCESHFSVLPHFRAKDQSLCRLHYITSTNCGLAQGNMTWCFKNRGKDYHWIVDLYERLHLPVLPTVVQALKKAAEERMSQLLKKTDKSKKAGISKKIARAEDQQERKKWGKRQAILHTYGMDDGPEEGDVEDEGLVRDAERILDGETTGPVVTGKKCRCGSTSHKRTTHRSCPLIKTNKAK